MSEGNSKRYTRINIVPQFNHGDLVQANPYGSEIFRVESYTVEGHRHYEKEYNYDTIVYDLTSLQTSNMAISEQKDMTLVAGVDQSDEYIRANDIKFIADDEQEEQKRVDPFIGFFMPSFNSEPKEVKEVKKNRPKHRDIEKLEIKRRKDYRKKIDDLLDEYNTSNDPSVMNEIRMRALVFEAGGYFGEKEAKVNEVWRYDSK